MSILNDIFSYFITQRLKAIEDFTKSPLEAQHAIFKSLIEKGKTTAWGKENGYSNIRTYDDYARLVPLQDYNSLKPFIERMMSGEANVLWPEAVSWFAKSSGTTDDKSKFIPISLDSLQDCHYRAGKDIYALFYDRYNEANLIDGQTLVLGGSHEVSKLNEKARFGDLSAVLMQNAPFWAEFKRTPSLDIALMSNWEEKIEKMAQATVNQNITNIMGVPTWTIVLIKRLFEMTGKDNLTDIWPELQLYVHGGVSFTPYHNLFNELIRSPQMHYMETYNASEGFFGIQDDSQRKDMLLLLDHGIFYEFIPAEQIDDKGTQAVPLEGVKANVNYAVVISTNGGLWRYILGDTVKFTSMFPFRIEISGRTRHFINAFGEEVIVENAEKAIARVSEKLECIVSDFTAAPIYFSSAGNGAHEWVIEFEKAPFDIEHFTRELDGALQSLNSDYEAKRQKDIALRMPVIHVLQQGTFYAWMKKRGKLGGQHKVPRLSNNREFVEDILEFSGADRQ
ncbi:MAG: GH3 auxin-responsive promoter family protein [Bacteroidota bacterium]|nr:GH3 auxin-responsive promoter family protein [Bacteroidota bacterium]